MSVAVPSLPTVHDVKNKLRDVLNGGIKHDVEEHLMTVWDRGVFLNELHKQGIVLRTGINGAVDGRLAAKKGLTQGTYAGTRMALTEIYSLIEEAFASHFNSRGLDPIIPTKRDLKQKQDVYQWSNPAVDGFPPHLQVVPPDQQDPNIFDQTVLAFISNISQIFSFAVPDSCVTHGTPFKGPTIADCEQYNHEHPSPQTDIMDGKNLGDEVDWYSDARFAQQHLTGVNPITIKTAPVEKVKEYAVEANNQRRTDMETLLLQGEDLLIQDYSWFRAATGVSNDQEFSNIVPEVVEQVPTGKFTTRYACAPIVIFQLHPDGRLHPLAITLDYKGNLNNSITIFNRRLTPDVKGPIEEKDDWPWRYAKTCAQTADWASHEVGVHLVETHLVEEAIIVATNRTIPEDHLLYELLYPHWFRTLPLNAAARSTLVPAIVTRLAGFGPSFPVPPDMSNRTLGLLNYAYHNFNFQEKYVPNDLKKRGFDIDGVIKTKYRNYPYAYEIDALWKATRQFISTVLKTKYHNDTDIQNDPYIPDWCREIQTKGEIPTFPTITTLDQLIDAVTMCIHTAAPQHTAVNYLQNYYYNFVPSKPPALCTPLPQNLQALQAYTENDLTAALPIGSEGPKWKDWLLAAQLPELLSFRVESKYNLITYAASLYNVNKSRTRHETQTTDCEAIKEAAAQFYSQLKALGKVFELLSAFQTEGTVEYKVLQPDLTAVSILI
ncbi:lipoxygenase [Hypoxylon argillaceum]|nr:lipoxygenase [Hypoxylon argillaceum]